MNRFCLLLCAVFLLASWGCRSKPEVIWATDTGELSSLPVTQEDREREAEKAWESTLVDPATDPRLQPVFIAADDAEECPTLTLLTFEGEKVTFQPAQKGKATLVVFWSMDFAVSPDFVKANAGKKLSQAAIRYLVETEAPRSAPPAALLHARNLERTYRNLGFRVVGVAERTVSYKLAPEFIKAHSISCPIYYDDFSALKAMGSAGGVKPGNNVPCFFILDKLGRVRAFKRGFSFTGATSVYPRVKQELIIENAARGEHVEDYLKTILRER